VLPFRALGQREATAFTEGIHGDVLTRLSGVSGLRAISRTSVQQYRDTKKTIPEIGRKLGVHWVLEGEVQEVAGQFRMNARLVNAREDRQVWAQDYWGALTAEEVFQIQSEITKKIVRALEAELTPEEVERVEHRPTEDLEAYRLYAQGRGHLDERTEGAYAGRSTTSSRPSSRTPVTRWPGPASPTPSRCSSSTATPHPK
jgi:TolB-like protein